MYVHLYLPPRQTHFLPLPPVTAPSSPLSPPVSPTITASELPPGGKSGECTICFDQEVDTVIYTCGHMCLCNDCGLKLKRQINACCPICRRPIKDVIKTYRPWWAQMLEQVLRLPLLYASRVPFSGLVGHRSWPQLESRQNLDIIVPILEILSGERLGSLRQNGDAVHLNTKTAYMSSFILPSKDERTCVLPFCMWCLLCHMLSRRASCTYSVFSLIVLDLCVL